MSKLKYANFADEESIFIYAFRYCLGRRTYATSIMTSAIIDNWLTLSDCAKELIQLEIKEYKERHGSIGDKQLDEPTWLLILDLEIK